MNKQVISAGGLVYQNANQEILFVLVGSGNPIVWCIPKGMQEKNEGLEETALREVQEETGLQTEIDTYVDKATWSYEYGGEMWDETAHFYLLVSVGGDITDHDAEFDIVKWFKADEAIAKLYYDNEKRIAHKALNVLKSRI